MSELDKSKFPLFNKLSKYGYCQITLAFPTEFQIEVEKENWPAVDQFLFKYLEIGGVLYNELIKYHHFDHTEHMIAIRESSIDEDGIWHDDGSRHFAFTWSFNDDSTLEGGELLFKEKSSSKITVIEPPKKEILTVFLTGHYNYEHKVNRVTNGSRKTFVGWCTSSSI